jgi:hypothetical protein
MYELEGDSDADSSYKNLFLYGNFQASTYAFLFPSPE